MRNPLPPPPSTPPQVVLLILLPLPPAPAPTECSDVVLVARHGTAAPLASWTLPGSVCGSRPWGTFDVMGAVFFFSFCLNCSNTSLVILFFNSTLFFKKNTEACFKPSDSDI